MATPTQRTLDLLRTQGYYPWVVERFNAFSGRRTDLFHVIDIICVVPTGALGVQSCGTAFADHRTKMMKDEAWHTRHWLKGQGNELVLIGWRKLKHKRGGKLMVYKPRLAVITLEEGDLVFKELNSSWVRSRKNRG